MQQPSSGQTTSQQQADKSEGAGECCDSGQEMKEEEYARAAIRRNALTPESDQIEPIKQTEIQERMSSLAVGSSGAGSSAGGGESSCDGAACSGSSGASHSS